MSFEISKSVPLADCCEIISGSTPSRRVKEYWEGGDIDWFTPKDLSGIKSKYIGRAPEKITNLGLKSCSTAMLPSNTLLLSSRAPIGHIAILKSKACTNQGFKSLIPKENIDVEYLYYAIKKIVPQLKDMGNGATFKEISKATLSGVKIPLPTLAEQQKIAEILDAADALRQKDQQLIDHYTALSQSLFLDMFGDPVINQMCWDEFELADLFASAPRIGTTQPATNDGKTLVVRVGELGKKLINFSKSKYVNLADKEKNRYTLIAGDIVLARAIGSLSHLGKSSMFVKYKAPVVFDSHVMRLRFDNQLILPEFFYAWMHSRGGRAIFLRNSGETAVQFNINARQISGIKIKLPPLELQNQFADRIALIEQQKQQAEASLAQSNNLFNSLLQKAFTGELTQQSERAA